MHTAAPGENNLVMSATRGGGSTMHAQLEMLTICPSSKAHIVCCDHQPPRNSPDAATNAMVMIYLDRLAIRFVGCVDPVVACVHVHGIQVTEVFYRVLVFRM